MAAPSTPTNLYVQQGNAQVFVSCDLTATATTYKVYRSTDGITYSALSPVPTVPQFLDTTVTVGTIYYYKMTAVNVDGESTATAAQTIIPARTGIVPLGQVRLQAQQEADMVFSKFVSVPEWNNYINNSYFELYDLLVATFEDYYVGDPATLTLTGASTYALPNGVLYSAAPACYKVTGVDLAMNTTQNAWLTLKKFEFASRNRYVYPQLNSTILGVNNLCYRIVGNNLMFIPSPSSAQYARLWYVPRMTRLLQDTDMLDGISGWDEYVVVDSAIKALGKEESGVQELMIRKQALLKRIEEMAANRDAGMPDRISDTRTRAEAWGGYGYGNSGPIGGF